MEEISSDIGIIFQNQTDIIHQSSRCNPEKSLLHGETNVLSSRATNRRFLAQTISHPFSNEQEQEKVNRQLIRAIRRGDFEKVKKSLASGADVNACQKGEGGIPALHLACLRSSNEIVQLLIDAGSDLHRVNVHGLRAIDYAVSHHRYRIIEMLSDAGGRAIPVEGNINESLERAVMYRDVELARACLEAGASFLHKRYPDIYLAAQFQDPSMAALLIEYGADVNEPMTDHWESYPRTSPLQRAAFLGNAATVKVLLDAGADVNYFSEGKRSTLAAAIGSGKLEIIQILVEAGADINASASHNHNVLFEAVMFASARNDVTILRYLLEQGANPNDPINAIPVLWQAVWDRQGNPEIVRVLIDYGVNLDDLHWSLKESPLHVAERVGNQEIIELLRAAGAHSIENK